MFSSLILTSCNSLLNYNTKISKVASKEKAFLCLKSNDGTESILRILNLSDYTYYDVRIPLVNPHSIIQNKINTNEIFIFELVGSAVKLDILSMELIKIDCQKQGNDFFHGHAVQTNTGEILWCTESSKTHDAVIVRARSIKDLQIVDIPDNYFLGGHHIAKIPETSIIVSEGPGERPDKQNIIFYDYQLKKIVKKIPCDVFAMHFLPFSFDNIFAVTAAPQSVSEVMSGHNYIKEESKFDSHILYKLNYDFSTPLVHVGSDGLAKTFWDASKKELFKFGLPIALVSASDNMYLSGHVLSNTVILWKGYEIVKIFNIKSPLSIISRKDAKEFVVLSENVLHVFSLNNFSKIREIKYESPIILLSSYA